MNMKVEIKVPAMGESIVDATVGSILKPTGSAVQADEEILELETDKVNQVLYAPQAGIITLTVKPEENVKIGQVIGYVEAGKEAPQKEAPPSMSIPVLAPAAAKEPKKKTEHEEAPATGAARYSKEAYVADLLAPPSVVQEIPSSREPAPVAPVAPVASGERRETRRKMSKVRKVIAARLVEAQQTTAMLTTFNEVDMSQVMALREKYKEAFNKKNGVRLGFMSFFVKAVVSALKTYPDFNSYIDGDEIVTREYFDIGIAIGSDRGLFVPVVRNCDQLTYAQIEAALEAYAKSAREGTIKADDLQGGGFTITNGGVYGSLLSTPILNPPQSGILGMHKIEKRPVVINDQVVIRPMMYLALSYDHRIVDGKEAVTFLVHIKEVLEDPARLLLQI